MPKATKKKKGRTKPSLTQQKKKLWKYFSAYIRARDGYRCFTCDRFATGSGMHAGHFITNSVGGLGLRYEETNVHAQCLTEHSALLMEDGSRKSIKDVVVGDRLLAFDEKSFEKKVAIVEYVRSFIPKELYRVEMENGSIFYATGDHQVVSNGKWHTIQDMLHGVYTHDILEQ